MSGAAEVFDFAYTGSPARIVFRQGAIGEVGDALQRLGRRRALVLSTPRRTTTAERIAADLGDRAAGIYAGAVMHTPVEVTEDALRAVQRTGSDSLVAVGGGSTIGLGKALAYRTGLPLVAVPTTYSGSEATAILGQTEGGRKTTLRDPRVLPVAVLYDPLLGLDLPVATSVASGLNAMAHAIEALYAVDRNPVSSLMAVEGVRALVAGLPAVVAAPRDLEARSRLLYGAWLCGTVLGATAMALHHKLCHVLGGLLGTPHAETHAVVLPHAVAFNAAAAGDLLRPLEPMFGAPLGPGLYDLAARLGAPAALGDLGVRRADLARVAKAALLDPYRNPRPLDYGAILRLLEEAWEGARPSS